MDYRANGTTQNAYKIHQGVWRDASRAYVVMCILSAAGASLCLFINKRKLMGTQNACVCFMRMCVIFGTERKRCAGISAWRVYRSRAQRFITGAMRSEYATCDGAVDVNYVYI